MKVNWDDYSNGKIKVMFQTTKQVVPHETQAPPTHPESVSPSEPNPGWGPLRWLVQRSSTTQAISLFNTNIRARSKAWWLKKSSRCPASTTCGYLVSGIPIGKIWVSWDEYSQCMEKYQMFQTTNQYMYSIVCWKPQKEEWLITVLELDITNIIQRLSFCGSFG